MVVVLCVCVGMLLLLVCLLVPVSYQLYSRLTQNAKSIEMDTISHSSPNTPQTAACVSHDKHRRAHTATHPEGKER